VALAAAWMGLVMLILSVVFLFLPGSTNARAELEHQSSYSAKDWFLPIPIYGIAMAMFLGFVVIWQMRKEPRPLPQPMVFQQIQAWFGILLALVGAAIIYIWVGIYGPA